MKNIALLIGITQGILSLSISALASEGPDSLFALSKISGPGRTSVGRLSDRELARIKGGEVPSVTLLTLVPTESFFQQLEEHLASQSNVAQQSNSATVSQEGGDNSSSISQENSRTQTNSGTSGNNQSTQSNNTTVHQTPPGSSTIDTQGNGASGHPGTVTVATEDHRTVITVTSQGKSVTIVVPESISVQTLLSAFPVQTLASVDFRALQAVINNVVSGPIGWNVAIGLQNP